MAIKIIGGGLAGVEAAWQLAKRGVEVEIFEQRKSGNLTFAHRTTDLAELVCSNSLRSDDPHTAIGLLHQEMRMLDSLVMKVADKTKLPAGSALAVDRQAFSQNIEQELIATNKVKIIANEEVSLAKAMQQQENIIVASGPLTSEKLIAEITKYSQIENLAFFDAIAPIVYKDSIDFALAWKQSRYNKGEGADYINCQLDRQQYYQFVENLLAGEVAEFKEWEKNTPYFDGCLPIEVMASRGVNTLRFGPMKPVGLVDPNQQMVNGKMPKSPFAVVQLRQDNKIDTLYNIVGFQTKLKYHEQQRIFRTIPGLENAEFARLGGIHRNFFINSPKLLNSYLHFLNCKNIKFAGQVTGVEGYVESASIGLLAGIFTFCELANKKPPIPKQTTAIGALLNHICGGHISSAKSSFQPMNVNFGLFLPVIDSENTTKITKEEKRQIISSRSNEDIKDFINLL